MPSTNSELFVVHRIVSVVAGSLQMLAMQQTLAGLKRRANILKTSHRTRGGVAAILLLSPAYLLPHPRVTQNLKLWESMFHDAGYHLSHELLFVDREVKSTSIGENNRLA